MSATFLHRRESDADDNAWPVGVYVLDSAALLVSASIVAGSVYAAMRAVNQRKLKFNVFWLPKVVQCFACALWVIGLLISNVWLWEVPPEGSDLPQVHGGPSGASCTLSGIVAFGIAQPLLLALFLWSLRLQFTDIVKHPDETPVDTTIRPNLPMQVYISIPMDPVPPPPPHPLARPWAAMRELRRRAPMALMWRTLCVVVLLFSLHVTIMVYAHVFSHKVYILQYINNPEYLPRPDKGPPTPTRTPTAVAFQGGRLRASVTMERTPLIEPRSSPRCWDTTEEVLMLPCGPLGRRPICHLPLLSALLSAVCVLAFIGILSLCAKRIKSSMMNKRLQLGFSKFQVAFSSGLGLAAILRLVVFGVADAVVRHPQHAYVTDIIVLGAMWSDLAALLILLLFVGQ